MVCVSFYFVSDLSGSSIKEGKSKVCFPFALSVSLVLHRSNNVFFLY